MYTHILTYIDMSVDLCTDTADIMDQHCLVPLRSKLSLNSLCSFAGEEEENKVKAKELKPPGFADVFLPSLINLYNPPEMRNLYTYIYIYVYMCVRVYAYIYIYIYGDLYFTLY